MKLFFKSSGFSCLLRHQILTVKLMQHSNVQLFTERSLHADQILAYKSQLLTGCCHFSGRQHSCKYSLLKSRDLCIFKQFLTSGRSQDISFCLSQVFYSLIHRTHQYRLIHRLCAAAPDQAHIVHLFPLTGRRYIFRYHRRIRMCCIDYKLRPFFTDKCCDLFLIHASCMYLQIFIFS